MHTDSSTTYHSQNFVDVVPEVEEMVLFVPHSKRNENLVAVGVISLLSRYLVMRLSVRTTTIWGIVVDCVRYCADDDVDVDVVAVVETNEQRIVVRCVSHLVPHAPLHYESELSLFLLGLCDTPRKRRIRAIIDWEGHHLHGPNFSQFQQRSNTTATVTTAITRNGWCLINDITIGNEDQMGSGW
eukprot:scaffold28281_cov53-Attheya_sp.AAC.2